VAAVVAAALAASLVASPSASAKPRGSVVVVTEGPEKDLARSQAAAAVGDYTVIEPGAWQTALAQQGHKGGVGLALRDAKKKRKLLDQIRRAAHAVEADDVIVVLTGRAKGGKGVAAVTFIDPEATDSPTENRMPLARGNNEFSQSIQSEVARLHPHGGDSSATATASTSPASSAPAASTPASAEPSSSGGEGSAVSLQTDKPAKDEVSSGAPAAGPTHHMGTNMFDVAAGLEGGMRHLNFTDNLSKNLRDYSLGAAPLVGVDGALYPFPLFGVRVPVLSDLGLVANYALAVGVQSTLNGANISTHWSRYNVGGRLRGRLGATENPIVLALGVAYGDEAFTFSAPSGTAALPAVDYHYIKVSGDGRIPVGPIAIVAGVAYMNTTSAGEVASLFLNKPSVGGFEADLGAALGITTGLEARLTASYRRFFYSIHPTMNDTYYAGGATDEFGGLEASLAYVY
jgi:hypothetical protein